MNAAFGELREAAVPTRRACVLIGRARATHYRHARGPVHGPRPARMLPDNGQALSDTERQAVLRLINTHAYADLAIAQIWARELDEGRYLCSASTMYRIARGAGQSRERRRLATHPAKVKPELLADGPSQVWTWDITKLRGPAKGIFYQLYVLIDIFSRFNPSWIISPVEDSLLATDFIAEAIERNGCHPAHRARRPRHVDDLQARLGAAGRPGRHPVALPAPRSNDNPFSEAQFKTLKYLPDFPESFESLADARQFCAGFFHEYNYIHRHSGIAWHTPASVHFGTADAIDEARQTTLTAAYHAHPERFGHRPHPPVMPTQSWINQPTLEPQMN